MKVFNNVPIHPSTVTEIAETLGRSKSTLSRELRRNATPAYKVYLSHRAHERAVTRKQEAGIRPRLKNEQIVTYVRNKLEQGLSPELIAGRIGLEHSGLGISHEAIYQYIYHPKTEGRAELIGHLVRGHRKRKTKGIGRRERKTKIPNRIPIEERPVSIESRSRFGHWEGDSLVSRKSLAALNSLVERKSRLLFLTRLKRKSAGLTTDTVIRRLQELPEKSRRTLTLDNGTENAQHEAITDAIGMQCYFARPYASWQRGTNESVNGLVRRYFPKGTDFSKITDEQVAKVESLINNRPRKCLGYKTPLEVASAFCCTSTLNVGAFVGITSDPIRRPIGKQSMLRFGNKEFVFFPLLHERDENYKTGIPYAKSSTKKSYRDN